MGEPQEEKATLFYYRKGDMLYGDFGASPAFRIAWPVFCNAYGKNPSCEDLAGVDCPACKAHCQKASEIIASGEDPMPLSAAGIKVLDWAIRRLTAEAQKQHRQGKALFVVGTPAEQPLYADKIYKEQLEKHGYAVILIQDKDVTEADCMASDIMLISATISGGAVGTRLNNCSTPQMIWESRLFSLNGMAAMVEEAQRVTSVFFHEYHEASWVTPDLVPPLPTGAMVQVMRDGVPTLERFWTVDDYGMNYISKSKLGGGVTIVAILPPENTGNFTEPNEDKATLFYYGKGDALFGDFGASPAFRLAWPAFCNADGKDPSCEDLAGVDCPECKAHCQNASEIIASDEDPMPLSAKGIRALDWAITRLTAEAEKERLLAGGEVEGVPDWDGEEDALAGSTNMTLDAMVAATLSNAAAGCFASTTLLRSCGARCFGRAGGHVRADCISACLDATLHFGSCARCYGARSDCTMVKCLQPCARSATGAACTGCVHAKCGGDCR